MILETIEHRLSRLESQTAVLFKIGDLLSEEILAIFPVLPISVRCEIVKIVDKAKTAVSK